ncbi:hypothetical protein [Sapporo virus]|nr:hypothetical protein [Sapporo virus]
MAPLAKATCHNPIILMLHLLRLHRLARLGLMKHPLFQSIQNSPIPLPNAWSWLLPQEQQPQMSLSVCATASLSFVRFLGILDNPRELSSQLLLYILTSTRTQNILLKCLPAGAAQWTSELRSQARVYLLGSLSVVYFLLELTPLLSAIRGFFHTH